MHKPKALFLVYLDQDRVRTNAQSRTREPYSRAIRRNGEGWSVISGHHPTQAIKFVT
jgi:enamine deaminase RidA (YjgF/YER057c/UK114 family)